jgi:hypothetical protein
MIGAVIFVERSQGYRDGASATMDESDEGGRRGGARLHGHDTVVVFFSFFSFTRPHSN